MLDVQIFADLVRMKTADQCPLSGVNRTSATLAQMSAIEPKRTLKARHETAPGSNLETGTASWGRSHSHVVKAFISTLRPIIADSSPGGQPMTHNPTSLLGEPSIYNCAPVARAGSDAAQTYVLAWWSPD